MKSLAIGLKQAITKYSSWKKGNFTPLHVDLLVSSRCNLKCVMCNVWPLAKKDPSMAQRELGLEEYEKLFDELSILGTESLCISGGEPLLRKDVFSIIKKAKKKGFFVELITNGTLITEEIAAKVLDSEVDMVTISIDAPIASVHDKIRGSQGLWEQSTRGLRKLYKLRKEKKSKKPRLAVDYVFNKINYKLIPDMIDLKHALPFDEIHLIPIIGRTSTAKALFLDLDDLRWLRNNLALLKHKMQISNLPTSRLVPLSSICDAMLDASKGKYKILNTNLPRKARSEIKCFAASLQATIDPFGNVYPCCYACTFQNSSEDLTQTCWGDKDFPVGNLREQSFAKIWNGSKLKEFKENSNKGVYKMCNSCGYDFSASAIMTAALVSKSFLLQSIPNYAHLLVKKSVR